MMYDCEAADQCPEHPGVFARGECGCGIEIDHQTGACPEVCEDENLDTDGDGTPDCRDRCPNDENLTEPGVCGCNAVDADNDMMADCEAGDRCPAHPGIFDPGPCGCGVEIDHGTGACPVVCEDEEA